MDSKSQIKQLQIIFATMAGVAFAFGGVALSMGGMVEKTSGERLESLLTMAFAGFTAMQLVLSFWLPSRMLQNKEEAPIHEKLTAYRTAKTLTGALCETAALMWGVLLLLSGNFWYALPMALCLTFLLTRFPTMMELEAWLGKRQQDIDRELQSSRR